MHSPQAPAKFALVAGMLSVVSNVLPPPAIVVIIPVAQFIFLTLLLSFTNKLCIASIQMAYVLLKPAVVAGQPSPLEIDVLFPAICNIYCAWISLLHSAIISAIKMIFFMVSYFNTAN